MARTPHILRLDDAPEDPVRRIMWLSGVMDAVRTELDAAFGAAYYEARLQGQFKDAVNAGPHATSTALAYSRHENRRRGQMVRWGDGLDPTSR